MMKQRVIIPMLLFVMLLLASACVPETIATGTAVDLPTSTPTNTATSTPTETPTPTNSVTPTFTPTPADVASGVHIVFTNANITCSLVFHAGQSYLTIQSNSCVANGQPVQAQFFEGVQWAQIQNDDGNSPLWYSEFGSENHVFDGLAFESAIIREAMVSFGGHDYPVQFLGIKVAGGAGTVSYSAVKLPYPDWKYALIQVESLGVGPTQVPTLPDGGKDNNDSGGAQPGWTPPPPPISTSEG